MFHIQRHPSFLFRLELVQPVYRNETHAFTACLMQLETCLDIPTLELIIY